MIPEVKNSMKTILNFISGHFYPGAMKVLFFVSFFLIAVLTDSQAQFIKRIGASIGNGFNNKQILDVNGEDFKIRDSHMAWKVFAATSWKFIGLEGGYRNFGEIEQNYSAGKGTSKTRGGDLFATGTVDLRILEVFGKAGAFYGRTRSEFYDTGGSRILNETDRDLAFAWGLGAGINLGILHIRAEYENMHISPGNLAMLSVGAGFNLGRSRRR